MLARLLLFYSCGTVGALTAFATTVFLSESKLIPFWIHSTLSPIQSSGTHFYARLVFGGLWAILGMLPGLYKLPWYQGGFILSLFPTLAQLLYFLPQSGGGWFGSLKGSTYVAIVVVVNIVWGLVTALIASRVQKRH